jgi:hypothetical protein
MKNEDAIVILEALGAGYDPETGEVLESESILKRSSVLQALFIAVRAIKNQQIDIAYDTSNYGSSIEEVAQKLGINFEKLGSTKFEKKGWFYTGRTVIRCQECSHKFHGFRRPYISSNKTYYHWLLVCRQCQKALEPRMVSKEDRNILYQSSAFRPSQVPY